MTEMLGKYAEVEGEFFLQMANISCVHRVNSIPCYQHDLNNRRSSAGSLHRITNFTIVVKVSI